MSGVIIAWEAGVLEAGFRHDRFDYLMLDIHMHGAVRVDTEVDDLFRKGRPDVSPMDGLRLSMRMSSTFCPIRDFIRFLEAIVVGVQECAFEWDAEGPDGRMEWLRSSGGRGFLTVFWPMNYRSDGTREDGVGMLMERRQVVTALYYAFRSFAESASYRAQDYEWACGGDGQSETDLRALRSCVVEAWLAEESGLI